jgi:stress response protein SCP2
MENLTKGQRVPLAKLLDDPSRFGLGIAVQGLTLDFACFGLNAHGKLSDERYMTFFNQPRTPCGAIEIVPIDGDPVNFSFRLARLPASIERLVLTASVDGSGTMAQLQSGYVRLLAGNSEQIRFAFSGADFHNERAVMLAELYRRDGQWRFMAVGQGFDGGLDALVQHFGGQVASPATPASPPPPAANPAASPATSTAAIPLPGPSLAKRVSLEKRIERETPHLVSLVKSASVSLAKAGLAEHQARVCLVLDISGSMMSLYQSGAIQKFAERILALGCRFDDDGAIDVFLFGQNVHHPAPMELANCSAYVQQAIVRHPLEGDTRYGRAMAEVREFYFPDAKGRERTTPFKAELPVYVMFVTDGSTSDQPQTEKQLRWSSMEPIFWQFMGIGRSRKSKNAKPATLGQSDFPFLEKLDELDGRLVDNANFFSTASPDEFSDSELYDLLMTEYPGWVKLAKQHGLL